MNQRKKVERTNGSRGQVWNAELGREKSALPMERKGKRCMFPRRGGKNEKEPTAASEHSTMYLQLTAPGWKP